MTFAASLPTASSRSLPGMERFSATGQPGDGGPALSVFLGMISGLAADGNGNIYVTEPGGPLHVSELSGASIRTGSSAPWSKASTGSSPRMPPGNWCSVLSGLLLVANDGTITKIAPGTPKPAPDGTLAREAWLLDPGPVAFNQAGRLYFGERQTCVIRKITNGVLMTFADRSVPPRLLARPRKHYRSFLTGQHGVRQPGSSVGGQRPHLNIIAPDGSITPRRILHFGRGTVIALDGKDRLYLMNLFSLIRVAPDGP